MEKEKPKHFALRITEPKLYPLLKKIAEKNKWSVNDLINHVLEQEFVKPKNNYKIN